MRSFTLYVRGSLQVSDFLDTFSLGVHGHYVFPNLAELTWVPNTAGLFRYLRLFLTPRMTHLSLNPVTAADLSVLSILPTQCPALKHVAVHNLNAYGAWATPSVSALVRRLGSIESPDVAELDRAALLHIAGPHNLKSLQLRSEETPSFWLSRPLQPHPTDPVPCHCIPDHVAYRSCESRIPCLY